MKKINSGSYKVGLLSIPPSLFVIILPFSHTNAIRYISLALTLPLFLYVIFKERSFNIPLKAPLVTWSGIALLSLVWAVDMGYSLHEIKVELLYGIICFTIFYTISGYKGVRRTIYSAVFFGATCITVLSLNVDLAQGGLNHVDGFHNKVGYLSTYITTLTPMLLLFAVLAHRENLYPAVIVILFLLMIYLAYLTQNLGFWISGTIQFSTIMLLFRYAPYTSNYKKLLFSVIAVSVVIASMYVGLVTTDKFKDMIDSYSPYEVYHALAERDASDHRSDVWDDALDIVIEDPLTGAGFGRKSFGKAYPEIDDRYSGPYWHAHNLVINYAVQMGMPGVIALLYLFGALSFTYIRLYFSGDFMLAVIGTVGLSIVVGVFVKSMFDDFFVDHLSMLFWTFNGLLMGHANSIKESHKELEV